MSSSKKKNKKKADGNQRSNTVIEEVVDKADFKVLFGKSSGVSNSNRISMNTSDLSLLGIKSGALVVVEFNSTVKVVLTAYSSSQTFRGSIGMARFWQPNFGENKDRAITISRSISKFTLKECSKAVFEINCSTDSISIDELQSSKFRSYIVAALQGSLLCLGTSFLISWKSVKFTLQVLLYR